MCLYNFSCTAKVVAHNSGNLCKNTRCRVRRGMVSSYHKPCNPGSISTQGHFQILPHLSPTHFLSLSTVISLKKSAFIVQDLMKYRMYFWAVHLYEGWIERRYASEGLYCMCEASTESIGRVGHRVFPNLAGRCWHTGHFSERGWMGHTHLLTFTSYQIPTGRPST